MSRRLRHQWGLNRPPPGPFTINHDSPQSDGLVMWLPWGGGYPNTHQHVDRVKGLTFTEGGTPAWVADSERGWSLLFDGFGEYLEVDTPVVTAPPFSVSLWFYALSNQWDTLFWIGDKSLDNVEGWQLLLESAGAKIYWQARSSSTNSHAWTSAGFNLNTWYHALGVEKAANDRSVYISGGNKGTNAGSRSPSGVDRTSIARMGDSTPSGYFDGRLHDIRVYNRALNDAEAWQLYDPATRWELCRLPRRLWSLYVAAGGVTYYQSVGGVLTFSGGLVKKTSKSLAGNITPTGSLDTKATFKQALSGAVTFVGTLSTSLTMRQALSGAISFVGGLATQYTAGPGGAWIRWIDHRLLKWRKKFQ